MVPNASPADVGTRAAAFAVRAALLLAIFCFASASRATAQELEPGAYWPIPVGLNIVTATNGVNWGDVAFDENAPIDEASATIDTTAFFLTRAFRLGRHSANAAIVLPIVAGHVEGLYLGQPAAVDRFGLGDVRLRAAVNLYGAPAMTMQEFSSYQMRTIVGISVSVVAPLGQYDSAKLINLGTNRWSFKPEVGVSRAFGPWVVEAMAGVWLFLDNDEFFGGSTRAQQPIVATQLHLTYRFDRSMWLAADANYYTGGRTTIGGHQNLDLQRNSRIGATFSKGLGGGHAIRASVSRGAYTTIGADFTAIAAAYSYAWGY